MLKTVTVLITRSTCLEQHCIAAASRNSSPNLESTQLIRLVPVSENIMLARKIILKNHFNGEPTLNNFELVEEKLPDVLQDGG